MTGCVFLEDLSHSSCGFILMMTRSPCGLIHGVKQTILSTVHAIYGASSGEVILIAQDRHFP